MIAWIAGAIGAMVCALPIAAQATRAYAIVDARMLAGPGDDYPVVGQVNRGAAVDLNRCLSDYSWCDVSFGSDRGWVYGMVVSGPYRDNVDALTTAAYREAPEGIEQETAGSTLAAHVSDACARCVDAAARD